MPGFEKIDDLLTEVYRNRKLFAALFDKRMQHVHEEHILNYIDDDVDKLERLSAYELIYRARTEVSLDPRLAEFFENYLEVNETVHILHIQECVDLIKENQQYYLKENHVRNKEQYLALIKKHLIQIKRLTMQNIKAVRNNTEEAYKTESNFELKREKLNNIRDQRNALEAMIKVVLQMVNDDLFFKTTADDRLLLIVHELRMALSECHHNLIEIQQQIIEYINHIEQRMQLVEKVIKLKMLRDKHYLKERTNFYIVATAEKGLPMKPGERLMTRLSVEGLLNNPLLQALVFKVRHRIDHKKIMLAESAGPLEEGVFDEHESVENMINLQGLKRVFAGKKQDLFTFILHHIFTEQVSMDQRIKIYCQLASRYTDTLCFTDYTEVYGDKEYAVIYADEIIAREHNRL